jgi:drug/metabolite transporter (DMT)-like permease
MVSGQYLSKWSRTAMAGSVSESLSAWVPYALAFLSIFLSSIAQVSLKLSVRNRAPGLHLLQEPIFYMAFALYGVSALLWLFVLSKLPLVVAYPLVSLNFILVALGGALVLHEHVSWYMLAGLVLIIGGIVLIVRR